jgi:hypothetical protein|uniref:Thioredoxin domain-containing protein n=1 Tax=viral metagenome TaxID=1070528 RepID=A0A6C0J432_9ZZZZ
MSENTIILYSKYSNSCTQLIQMLNSYPVDLESNLNLSLVCIDNENIRKQILRSKNIKINTVPCLLFISTNGEVNLYENDTVFQWFNEQIGRNPKLMIPSPEPPAPAPTTVSEPPIPDPPKPAPSRVHKNKVQEENQETDPPRHTRKSNTSIDNIDLDEKVDISRRPVPMINNDGGYDLTTDFGEPESPNRNVSKHIKSSTQAGTNSSDLMSQALAMQKEREKVEPKHPITPSNT